MSSTERPRGRRAPNSKGLVWLLVAALVIALAAGAVAFYAIGGRSRTAQEPASTEPTETVSTTATPAAGTGATTAATVPAGRSDDGSVAAAQKVVQDFYAALNARDAAAVGSLLAPEQRASVDAATIAEWEPNGFTLVRSVMEGQNAAVLGREKVDTFGSAAPGGVKYVLTRLDGAWYIADMKPADQGQVTGQVAATTATGGLKGALSDATARDLVTQLLKARQKGEGATIRKLTTAKFQTENGDAWLDGVDNTTSFTSFSITSVKLSGATASVVVSETWPDGTLPSTYGLVSQSGSIFVDTWQP